LRLFAAILFMAGHIVALGGGGFSMEPDNLALDRYILSLWRRPDREPRVCFIPTAAGDSVDYIGRFYSAFDKLECRPAHLALTDSRNLDVAAAVLRSDIFYVGGGNTREMLSVWRKCALDQALKEAWQAGKILCGISAGAICWFEQAISDSVVEGELHPLRCLGFLPGTGCPHYDEPGRRETFHRFLASGDVSAGYGIDNSAALHFEGIRLVNVVVSRPDAHAYHVELTHGQVAETAI
jgi:dipeptidase E